MWNNHTNWLGPDPCTYYGIKCFNKTISLSMVDNALEGIIPDSISDVPFISMDLSFNAIRGPFPTFMERMPSLTSLTMTNCLLSDSISSSIGTATQLVTLIVSANRLSGIIPSSIGYLNNLQTLDLSYNLLSGTIPDTIGNMTSLDSLSLNSNSLTGSIPKSIISIPLRSIEFSNNRLTGSLPKLYRGLIISISVANNRLTSIEDVALFSSLLYIDLRNNLFSGPLPDFSPIAKQVQISNNMFSGPIKWPYYSYGFNSVNTLVLDYSFNNLSGTIPPEVSSCNRLIGFTVSNNHLSGQVVRFNATPQIQTIDLSNNNLTGEFHWSDLCSYKIMYLVNVSRNNLVGQINCLPAGLKILDFSHNKISSMDVDLPNSLNHLDGSQNLLYKTPRTGLGSQLVYYNLSRNALTRLSDIGLFNQYYLTTIDLSHNQLSSNMLPIHSPVENNFVINSNLEHLDLSWNNLTGAIPITLYALVSLEYLDLSHNLFYGEILESFSFLTNLQFVELSYNSLSGRLPEDLGSNVQVFRASHNNITGQIPPSLFDMRSLVDLTLDHNYMSGPVAMFASQLDVLSLSTNRFTGNLSFLSDQRYLTCLELSDNYFSGNFPPMSSALVSFCAARNPEISGNIPDLSGTRSLRVLDLSGDDLSGSVPSFNPGAVLSVFNLSGNHLSSFTSGLPTLKGSCDLSNNDFVCQIPSVAYVNCSTRCSPSNYNSSTFRIRIHGDVASFDSNSFLNSLSIYTGVDASRFSILAVTSGSVIVDVAVSPASGFNQIASSDVTSYLQRANLQSFQAVGLNVMSVTEIPATTASSFPAGAIVGIVLGSLFVIIVICVTFFLLLRRKRGKNGLADAFEMEDTMNKLTLEGVEVKEMIGSGYFGQVYRGTWNGTTVALKTMKEEGKMTEDKRWKDEILLLWNMNHPNIVRLLGIHSEKDQIYMVLEYAELGALDGFLRDRKNANRLSNNDLLLMIFSLVKGMMYLQHRGVIHRDLATRNLLLDKSLNVKISDFGMSRQENFYRSESKEIPYRWAAPEVLIRRESTSRSDVWSFAVCVWEITSLGRIPYDHLSNKQVATSVTEKNLRLSQPPRCPDDIYEMMIKCWKDDPEERPYFPEIYQEMFNNYNEILSEHKEKGEEVKAATLAANSQKNLRKPPTTPHLPPPSPTLPPHYNSPNRSLSLRSCQSEPALSAANYVTDAGLHRSQYSRGSNSSSPSTTPRETVRRALSRLREGEEYESVTEEDGLMEYECSQSDVSFNVGEESRER
ncbi:putative LRR receptor-like serine/threonine-protein kinase [Planoprotostelium fungivorum]|uniref:Putative LRR receptor-like serine/threonine-protein kinase n=1 Tax=Planoprotostelium fungivorum TaxID=1890364 RepID=A0A2P6NMA8_9EUKA|nr:putative LRR receptor-like serine/threonine-protein kinase [Planoprotostelium fungivorum]